MARAGIPENIDDLALQVLLDFGMHDLLIATPLQDGSVRYDVERGDDSAAVEACLGDYAAWIEEFRERELSTREPERDEDEREERGVAARRRNPGRRGGRDEDDEQDEDDWRDAA
ncbi:MAG: hypothetical protein CMF76_10195 [Maricaulis sp.]|nr:hypothetical protein [Maricaulis sp.]